MGFLTPETLPARRFVRRLAIPDDLQFIANLSGALLELCDSENWQVYGSVSTDAAAEAALGMLMAYFNDNQIGEIVAYISAAAPPFVLPADGSSHLREDYPQLYEKIDPAFILDADHFFLPNLTGRVLVGASPDFAFGSAGGESAHTLSVAEMPSHTHGNIPHSHAEGIAVPAVSIDAPGLPLPSAIPGASVTGPSSITILSEGGNLAHNNMQPYFVIRYGVRYG
jgi:microcystin-dependent protein